MTTLTPTAQARLDQYLAQVRSSLRGMSVDAEEVVRDLREHIDVELEATSTPVSQQDLDTVLDRLGTPDHWVPATEVPWWRRALTRLISGPEDWRLAYLSFVLTVAGLLTLPFGGIVLLLAAYLLGRAAVAICDERSEPLAARRWLIYPALLLVVVPLLLSVLCIPGGLAAVVLIEGEILQEGFGVTLEGADEAIWWGGLIVGLTGVWWIVAALLGALLGRPLAWLLRPLATFRRRQTLWLGGLGLLLAVAGAAVLTWL
jgi:hypothetical protein